MKIKYILEVIDEDNDNKTIFVSGYFSQETMCEKFYQVDKAITEYADEKSAEMEEKLREEEEKRNR